MKDKKTTVNDFWERKDEDEKTADSSFTKKWVFTRIFLKKKGSEYKIELHKLTSSAFPIVCSLAGYQKKLDTFQLCLVERKRAAGQRRSD